MFTIPDESGDNIIRGIISFVPPVAEGDHIHTEEGIGKVVDTTGGVLLGKMSFQMKADTFDPTWFQLVPVVDDSPVTGIKVTIDGKNYYEANGIKDPNKNVFRFTDQIASKNANLSNMVLSSGVVNQTEADKSTYKEYAYTPEFKSDTTDYELTLLENIDDMDIKVTVEDPKSTLKMKVPKRNEQNQLVYESDGTSIKYEEKEIESDKVVNFTLNQLGEPDTNITIIVTAEDKKTTKEYTLVIKRPYGTIKGSVLTSNTKDIHKADVKVYDSSIAFDWGNMLNHDDLDLLTPEAMVSSKDDGSYEIMVIPGTYDLILDKPGYLDNIILNISLNKGDSIDLDEIELVAGDVNKDGIIELEDMGYINDNYDAQLGDGIYEIRFDFTGDELVDLEDMSLINDNYDMQRIIRSYQ